MGLQAVFIDVGNTLLYEKPSRFEIYAQAARERGREVSTRTMTELMHRAHQELPREIEGGFRYGDRWFEVYIGRIFHEGLGLPAASVPGIQEELFARFSDATTFRLFPDARECLAELAEAGLRLGAISNWSPRLPGILAALGVMELFDFVLCSAVERQEKPDRQIFENALEKARVAADRALHAGDHVEKDVRGARAAGLHALLMDHFGLHEGTDLPRVTGFKGLRDYVLERTA